MAFLKTIAVIIVSFLLYVVDSRGIAGNIKLVAMNGNQYWFSSSSPYAPNLNNALAYQYCRTLGLQLVVLETKEEVDTISAYLNSFEVGSIMNRNNYWTSGNRLGANSWLWMSSGEQLNGSFSDFPLLKQATDGPLSTNSKNCLSMKTTVAKRAIFTPDECEKSLPFICEQVRCLYYNYPVTQFPDPNDLRSDIEDGVGVTQSESESRSSLNFIPSEKVRSQNFISQRNANTLRLAQLASQDTRKTDPSKIQRRITLRPIPHKYPYSSSDYLNSFYKYQSVDYAATSTDRPSFKKTTRETLWSPWPSSNINPLTSRLQGPPTTTPAAAESTETDGSVTATVHKRRHTTSESSPGNNVTYITAQSLRYGSKSTIATTRKSSVSSEKDANPLKNVSSRRRAQLEIVKIRATERNSERGITTLQPSSEETSATGKTVEVIYSRRGPGFKSGSSRDTVSSSETTTLDPNKIVFDDEENNVGSEIEDIVEDVVIRDGSATTTTTAANTDIATGATDGVTVTEPMFFQGNGIRHPDTKTSLLSTIGIPVRRGGGPSEESSTQDREASQTQTPQTLREKMYQFQRSRSPISWALRNRSHAARGRSPGPSVSVTASTGPSKIALGPRLRFRTKSAISHA